MGTQRTNDAGLHGFGDGIFSYVADVRSELYVGDDHLGLNGIRATITDKLGRTLEIHGRAAGEYSVQPYGQGYFSRS